MIHPIKPASQQLCDAHQKGRKVLETKVPGKLQNMKGTNPYIHITKWMTKKNTHTLVCMHVWEFSKTKPLSVVTLLCQLDFMIGSNV